MARHYAIFGGSFNPIHEGHVSVVKHLLELKLDKVLVIPTGRSPFKQDHDLLPNDLRLMMVRATFQGWDRVLVSDIEIKNNQVNYTYDTLKQLHIQHEDVVWHLVVGLDAYQSFPDWKEAQAILNNVSMWVVQRPGREQITPNSLPNLIVLPELKKWFGNVDWNPQRKAVLLRGRELVRYFSFEIPTISSTEIRSGLGETKWIPEQARSYYLSYIEHHRWNRLKN